MYEKQTWNTGDVITEEKLNHMEDGIASGGSGGGTFFVGSTYDESTQIETLDKTWKEIVDAFNAGKNVILKFSDGPTITTIYTLAGYGCANNNFAVRFFGYIDNVISNFLADSENGYPSFDENGGSGNN